MLEFVVLSMLLTPYVLSWTSGGEEAIVSRSSCEGIKKDRVVFGSSLPLACLADCCLGEGDELRRS
jgi:hypothetical protein